MRDLILATGLSLGLAIGIVGCGGLESPTSPTRTTTEEGESIQYRFGSTSGIIHHVNYVGYSYSGFGMQGLVVLMDEVASKRRTFNQIESAEEATVGYLQGQEDQWGTGRVWTGKNERLRKKKEKKNPTPPPHPYTLCNYCIPKSTVKWIRDNGRKRFGSWNTDFLPYDVRVPPSSDTPHRPK